MQKHIEQQSLIVSSLINALLTAAGLYMFMTTGLQMFFMDTFFTALNLISTLMAILISKHSLKTSMIFPDGYDFLEPLYGVIKSLATVFLILSSTMSAARTAYLYFTTGQGTPLPTGDVLPYSLFVISLGLGLATFNHWQNKRLGGISILLSTESKANILDAMTTLGIGLAVYFIGFINKNGSLAFLHYTADFFITTSLTLLLFKTPIQQVKEAFIELVQGEQVDSDIYTQVAPIVQSYFPNHPFTLKKTGMRLTVTITLDKLELSQASLHRKQLSEDLQKHFPRIVINLLLA